MSFKNFTTFKRGDEKASLKRVGCGHSPEEALKGSKRIKNFRREISETKKVQ